MGLKIYLASSFRHIKEVVELSDFLEGEGHKVVCRWWEEDYKELSGYKSMSDDDWFGNPLIKTIYIRSKLSVKNCDCVIFVTPTSGKFNGANVEIGLGLAYDKPVIAYGLLERSGMYAEVIRANTLLDLTIILKELMR